MNLTIHIIISAFIWNSGFSSILYTALKRSAPDSLGTLLLLGKSSSWRQLSIFRSSKHFNFPIEPIIFPKLSQCRKVNTFKAEHPNKYVVLIMWLQLSRKWTFNFLTAWKNERVIQWWAVYRLPSEKKEQNQTYYTPWLGFQILYQLLSHCLNIHYIL